MGKRAKLPAVNAGSMADIAFLLLIFFLVTTTIETDVGLDRKLPSDAPSPPEFVNERNILEILINKDNELLVEGEPMTLDLLKQTAIDFIDNGGKEESCSYCKGAGLESSSDSPLQALISVKNHRETIYEYYIAVQNELVAAYHELRNREAQLRYQIDYTAMEEVYRSAETTVEVKNQFRVRIKELQELYPLHIVEPKNQ